MQTERNCVACRRSIDPAARLCPFCGADPETGARIDVKPLIESHFPPPPPISPGERIANFFRTRQMLSVAFLIAVGVGLLLAAHQWIQKRNRVAVAPTPGVTLTEVADLSRQFEERAPVPVPELEFPWEGDASKMQTFVLEPGAIAPPVDLEETTTAGTAAPVAPASAVSGPAITTPVRGAPRTAATPSGPQRPAGRPAPAKALPPRPTP